MQHPSPRCARARFAAAMEPLRGVVQNYEWGMRTPSCQARANSRRLAHAMSPPRDAPRAPPEPTRALLPRVLRV